MSNWTIRYRSATGPTTMLVQAPTREAAEVHFYDMMLDGDTFGSILTIVPVEFWTTMPELGDGSPAPQA